MTQRAATLGCFAFNRPSGLSVEVSAVTAPGPVAGRPDLASGGLLSLAAEMVTAPQQGRSRLSRETQLRAAHRHAGIRRDRASCAWVGPVA